MGAIEVLAIASYGAAVLGGFVLFAGPFTRSGRKSPHWTRVALWMSGPMSAAWGALGLTVTFAWQSLSRESYALAVHFKTSLGGMGVGVLILLFASGEFLPASWRRRGAKSR